MRRFFPVLLLALLVLSVSSISAQQGATPETPLQLIESSPAAGEELGQQREIVLYFDRPVNCDSAQTAITVKPQIEGGITCDAANMSVTFTPETTYEPGTLYTVEIATSLRGEDGASPAESITLELLSTGELTVTEVLPAPGTEQVEADSAITVIFNRPVVPLGIVEEMDDLPDPLTFSPEVTGEGEWLNTSIYLFRPDSAFSGGITYTVTVNAGLEAVDGSVLTEDFTWSFSTIDPFITEVRPNDFANDVRLDTSIQVTFNQPMDTESVEANFHLYPEDDPEQEISGTFTWNDDNTGFRFQFDELLELDTLYLIRFDAENITTEAGGAGLTGQTEYRFVTVPYPSVIATDPDDGTRNVSVYTSVNIYFSSPIDVYTLDDKITIEPEPWREPDTYYSDYDNSYYLSFPVEPSTDYTITIEPGIEDIYGNPIREQTVLNFTTGAYPPDVMLQVPGSVGFYNAYNEETRLFLTHRNVSAIDLSLYRVPLETFGALLTGDSYYNPADFYTAPRSELIRQWQIESDTPENQWRYELLSLGQGVSSNPAESCEGAPPSRLSVGDTAVVVSDPDPVRARASAPSGEVLTLMYRDYRLPIVGGPVCANGLLWWEVTLRDGQSAWVAEGDQEEYFLDVLIAAATTEVVLTDPVSEAGLAPGVYFLHATAPELEASGPGVNRHMLVVGTANLTVKQSIDSLLVWATNVNTGEPLVDVPIQFYDDNFNFIGTAQTDADGIARMEMPRVSDLYAPRVAILQTDDHFGIGATQWSDGIEPYQFGQNFNSSPEAFRTYIYTDRPIYRPDQPVYFRGVVRQRDDVTYTPPTFDAIPVTIYDENGEVVYERELPVTEFGTFSDTFEIAPDAPLGYYRIIARIPGEAVDEFDYYYRDTGSVAFRVAEYRLPEFQVEVTPAEPEVVQGDPIEVTFNARYFFGGAVSDSRVDYTAVAEPYYFDYTGSGRYSFTDFNYDGGPGEFFCCGQEQVSSGTGTTDAQGNLTVEIPSELEDFTQSQTFTIEAVVTDESDQAVAGRTEVIVHKGLLYVGVASEDYVTVVGETATMNLITVDWDSEPVPGQEVEVEVVERRWSSVQEEDESGRTTWTWEVEEIPVTDGTVTTDEDGKAQFTFQPPNGGIFKVTVRTRDAEGNPVSASDMIWVSSREYVSWRQQNSNRIDLVSGQDAYEVGDTAEILITSPFQGEVEALVTVERGDVLMAERITMTSNSYVYELPITPDYAPNIYVSVLMVKGVDENNPVAAFRMGMIQLAVDNERKQINIEIEPNVDQAGPGDTVTYTVRTTDYDGNPVNAEVGVGLTDLASLSIADPNTMPILQFFYGQQGLSIRTATVLTINTDLLTQTTLDTIKGGGGGFGEGGIFDIREEFIDTPYWNASVVTGEDGEATFDVVLPDNLTTWRLDARAVTSGEDGLTLVGQNTFDLLSTKPVLIRPVTPRFVVVGDEVTLAAIVNNNTQQDMPVEVSLEVHGATPQGDLLQTVTIPAGTRARVEWPVVVEDVEALELVFFANANDGEYTDASRPPLGQGDDRLLPVYRYEAPETVGTGGLIREGGQITEAIQLPQRFDVTQGELTVNLEPSLAATTIESLDYLQNFPHQCTEQTVSRFLPNIMTYRALDSLGIEDAELEANLIRNVNFGIQRLYAQQHVDGGWGWFVRDESNVLTTAYALIGLVEADRQGFEISDDVIASAQSFLTNRFIVPSRNQEKWRLNRQAFVLYALARSGAPDESRMATLYEFRDRLDYYAKAFLAMSLYINDPDDSRIDTLISDLMNGATVSATGTHWQEDERDYLNWNTDTRTTALALQALVMVNPDSDLIPNVVRYLIVMRQADAWETTQETAWAVMALTDWMLVTGEIQPDYTYTLDFNGETLLEGEATPQNATEAQELVIQVSEMLAEEANRLTFGRSDGNGVLYYTAHLRAFVPVPEIEPLNRGIIIERRYVRPGTDEPITEANVGELIQVRLTVIAPNDLHYVTIEDPIPAGTDAVDPGLATSQQIGTQPFLDAQDPLSRGWGWWWFSNIEFRDEKVVLYSTYLPAGTYEYVYTIRTGLAGTYNVIPPVGYEFYFPEVYGRGAGSTFTITD